MVKAILKRWRGIPGESSATNPWKEKLIKVGLFNSVHGVSTVSYSAWKQGLSNSLSIWSLGVTGDPWEDSFPWVTALDVKLQSKKNEWWSKAGSFCHLLLVFPFPSPSPSPFFFFFLNLVTNGKREKGSYFENTENICKNSYWLSLSWIHGQWVTGEFSQPYAHKR